MQRIMCRGRQEKSNMVEYECESEDEGVGANTDQGICHIHSKEED
jgi:hypothetical protein